MLLLPIITRIALSAFVLTTVFACGASGKDPYHEQAVTTPANLQFDPELQPYYDSYVADAEAAGVAIPEYKLREFQGLMWTDHVDVKNSSDATLLGHCQRRAVDAADESLHLRFVELLRPNAEGKVGTTLLDDVTLKVMVYHELGHCLHDFTGHTNGKSAAVMNAFMQPARYFDMDGLLRDHFLMLKRMQDDPSYRP